jgi:hypothetical protein
MLILQQNPYDHGIIYPRRTLFGYNAKPCFIDALFYLIYWLLVLCLGLYKWYNGTLSDADYKHKRMLRKQLEEVTRLILFYSSSCSSMRAFRAEITNLLKRRLIAAAGIARFHNMEDLLLMLMSYSIDCIFICSCYNCC